MRTRWMRKLSAAVIVVALGWQGRTFAAGYPDTRPTTPEKQAAYDAHEKMEMESKAESDAAWERAQPAIAEWAAKGKPYIPVANKPEDLPQAKIPAFPGAEGAGMYTFGGRGGKVIVVTSLEDSGPGTLRDAIEQGGPRIVVFNVAGIIHLKTPLIIRAPYISIEGQSAPGDGICVAGRTTEIDTHDTVIRYMRFRRGITDVYDRDDALGGEPVGNTILDHVSASWGLDETISLYRHMYTPDPNQPRKRIKQPTYNLTIQWTLITEGLDTYDHAFAGTWGGMNTTFHHNLISSCTGRNASIGMGFDFNFVNNVIFNWRHRTLDGGDGTSMVNCINNYYKPGPATNDGPVHHRIGLPQATKGQGVAPLTFGKWYIAGNIMEGDEKVTADNWAGGMQFSSEDAKAAGGGDVSSPDLLKMVRVDKPFPMPPITIQPAKDAYESVLNQAGATLPVRDPVDLRAIQQTRTGQVQYTAGKGIITDISQVGGYPEYKGTPYVDSDGDGIPDDWETAHGLNPHDPTDATKETANGYTNIEVFLNSLVSQGK